MSITLLNRDYTEPLDQDIQKLLDDISDFEFKTPDGLFFKMSDINKKVPIYLDLYKSRPESYEIKWKDLNNRIAKLEKEFDWLNREMDKTSEEEDKRRLLDDLITILKWKRDDYKKSHPNPSPNDKIPIEKTIRLSGYYTRNGKSHKPEIVLLMEELGNSRFSAKLVATTLIHEMFHAFYDHDLNENDISVPFVEEPLTEYGMLKFVEALANKNKQYDSLYKTAKDKVYIKQFRCGVAHYGFGYYLWKYEDENGSTFENIHWIDAFREAKYRLSTSTSEYKKYAKPFNSGFFPFDEERYYMALLRIILLNADGANLPLPTKKQINSIQNAHWNKFAPNAYWIVQDKTLYLEGDFSSFFYLCEVDRYVFLKNLCNNLISKIVLCDNFSCDNFYFVKEIIREIGGPIQVKLSKNNQKYSEEKGAIYDAVKTMLLYCPAAANRFTIPMGVKGIHVSAFMYCKDLKHVSIPASVEEISNYTFHRCVNLESVTIEEGLETIGGFAFGNCNLKEITLPATLKKVDSNSFSGCPMQTLTFKGLNPPKVDKQIISRDLQASCIIHVPAGCKTDYEKLFPKHTVVED